MKNIINSFLLLLTLLPFNLCCSDNNNLILNNNSGQFALAIGFCMGLAILGGSIGQGITAQSALSGIARNPGASGKIFVPMILCMALIESLVLFGLLISFMILGKI